MRSLRVKLALLAGSAAFLVLLAALALFWALQATDCALERSLAAQHRLELLAELSGRLTQYGLAAVDAASSAAVRTDRLTAARAEVGRALDNADQPASMSESDETLSNAELAARARPFARLRGSLGLLEQQIASSLQEPDPVRRADAARGALNGFAPMTGPALSLLIDTERRAIEAASEAAHSLSRRLRIASLLGALVALSVVAFTYRSLTRPLLARIHAIAGAASAIGRGESATRLQVGERDELGLLVAAFNRMAARLARRERRVVADRAALEETVAARTADLRAANERLAAIDQSRRRFFADVSHEFRTPLTVILGECDLASRRPPATPDDVRAMIGTIRSRAQGLRRRIEDLLRVARSEAGEIQLDTRPVSALQVLNEAVVSCTPEARRRRVALRLNPAPHDIEILADPEWMRQVVEGLIDNALRHARGATRIVIGLEQSRLGATITVLDDGPGFPAGEDQLLQRFARAGSAEGFGIGLSLAAWVVQHHGGSIHLGAGERGGARVAIDLPAETRENAA